MAKLKLYKKSNVLSSLLLQLDELFSLNLEDKELERYSKSIYDKLPAKGRMYILTSEMNRMLYVNMCTGILSTILLLFILVFTVLSI